MAEVLTTAGGLARLVGRDLADAWYPALRQAMHEANIDSSQREAHFLAQVLHESAGLRLVVENLNYTAEQLQRVWPARFPTLEAAAALAARGPAAIAEAVYGGRLGNAEPGDGWRYRGRGLLQLTGRANYAAYAAETHRLQVLEDPALLEQPTDAALSAAWYWRRRHLNELADVDDLEGITRRINGGLTGLEDRRAWLALVRDRLTSQPPEHATTQEPDRPSLRVLVLHDLTDADHRALLRAWLDDERTVALPGPWVTTTREGETPGTPKLDVRRDPQ